MITLNKAEELQPAFLNNNIAICLSSTPDWVKIAGVTITSIKKHANRKNNYDIVILEENVSEEDKNRLEKYNSKNFSVRFFNLDEYLKSINFILNPDLTVAAFYRLLIPNIFKNYKKVLYIDIDTILQKDIANVYFSNIEEYQIGAIKDFHIIYNLYPKNKSYFENDCNLDDINNYFNSGVLLFNIEKMLKNKNIVDEFLQIAYSRYFKYSDQCVLNIYYNKNKKLLKLLDNTNNYYFSKKMFKRFSKKFLLKYLKLKSKANILHYLSTDKPWRDISKSLYAGTWWYYALFSPFFKEICIEWFNFNFKKYIVAYKLCKI